MLSKRHFFRGRGLIQLGLPDLLHDEPLDLGDVDGDLRDGLEHGHGRVPDVPVALPLLGGLAHLFLFIVTHLLN